VFSINDLINTASSLGTYNGISTEMTTEVVVTQLIDDLSITKEASRDSWITGNMTYTITLVNDTEEPYEDVVVTDTINPALATLVDGTVKIDGVVVSSPGDYTFDVPSGLLTVNLGTVAATTTAVIEFDVERV